MEACQNVQVNETLSIRWEDEHPRVLWDGRETIAGSSCVSCGHCVTVCPCNALMEKSMIGHAGFLTGLPKKALDHMIDVVKAIEPQTGFGPLLQVSQADAGMREQLVRRTKTVCTYCGVGCSFDIWTRDRQILKVERGPGPANGISTCVKGKFGCGDSGSIQDIEQAALVVVVGNNTAESHPVLATRVKRAHKRRGQRLIVADLRGNEMARRVDIHLRPNPSTDLVWVSAISRYIVDHSLAKMGF